MPRFRRICHPVDQGSGDHLVFPPDDLGELLDLAHLIDDHTEPGLLIGVDGEQVPLPREVYRPFQQVEVMRQEQSTLVAPRSPLHTPQEAAEFLGVRGPTLVKLLEDGAIPFDLPNRHRRVRFQDTLDFRAHRHGAQRAALDQLVEGTRTLGLYESSAADNIPGLKSARRRSARERGK